MKRLLVAAPLVAGCIVHNHRDTDAPGIADVTKPPTDLTDRAAEKPGDPGERGVVVQGSASVLGVGWDHVGTRDHAVYMPFQLEMAASGFTLGRSHRGQVAGDALDGAVRPNVGLAMRVYSGANERVAFGPMWYELQYVMVSADKFWGATLGAGLVTTYAQIGPQATACFGIAIVSHVCLRGNWMSHDKSGVQLFLTFDGFAEWVWSR